MLDTCWSWPRTYSGHLVIVHPNLPILNNMAKVLYTVLCKGAFLTPAIQLMLAQLLKDHAQVLNVLTSRLTVHQTIIQIHSNILIEHI